MLMTKERETISAIRDEKGKYKSGIWVLSNNGLVRVEWVNYEEGYDGVWNPCNPKDVNFLRFNVHFRRTGSRGWIDPGNASFCTLIHAETEDKTLIKAAEYIASQLADHTTDGSHWQVCSKLAWLSTADIVA